MADAANHTEAQTQRQVVGTVRHGQRVRARRSAERWSARHHKEPIVGEVHVGATFDRLLHDPLHTSQRYVQLPAAALAEHGGCRSLPRAFLELAYR